MKLSFLRKSDKINSNINYLGDTKMARSDQMRRSMYYAAL